MKKMYLFTLIFLCGCTQKNPQYIQVGDALFHIEVARTKKETAIGLSAHKELGIDSGMLFVYRYKNIKPMMWMRGMHFPLDILWIKNGVIVHIDKNVSPYDRRLYSYFEPIDYVLEINGGESDRKSIQIRDSVRSFQSRRISDRRWTLWTRLKPCP